LLASLFLALSTGSCTVTLPKKDFVVVVDPGHGGRDSGAVAKDGLKFEKDIVLEVSRLLATKLSQEKRVSVILTRSGDYYLSLIQRQSIVKSCHPNLVVSIHADSGPPSARGGSVYVLNKIGEAVAVDRLISKRLIANDATDTEYILANLEQRASMNYSAMIASEIQQGLSNVSDVRSSKTANFALLKVPGIASLLVESGFITNEKDAARISSASGQAAISAAIAGPIVSAANRWRR
jgi:N-acetylmuramoyl-L-alanine amidase